MSIIFMDNGDVTEFLSVILRSSSRERLVFENFSMKGSEKLIILTGKQ